MQNDTKAKARAAVKRAVKSGRLLRHESCEECGCTPARGSDGRATIHAHHHKGYDNPLDVVWLCPVCHFVEDPRPSGESNGRAKLSANDVFEIRARYRPGRRLRQGSARGLAREYGVSNSTIVRIISGEIWIDAALKE